MSALAPEVYNAGLLTGNAVAATIAHEVKQPLSGMITNADAGLRWLDRSTPNLDKAKAAFEQIVADGHRAAAVIESIRAIFSNDARSRTSLDINEMIGEALALLRSDLQRHRILVQAAPNADVPQVRGDRIQLQQVLLNLITNAIDAMATKDGARILRFRSEVNDAGGVIVSVADNGPGIGPQQLKQIFNPLFTTKSGGMGMGLSICRSIVEAHGGRLWVESNKPEGAVFKFLLLADGATSAGASRRRAAGLRDELSFTSFRHGGFTEGGDAELTDREMLAQGRHTTVKVLPKYTKRTTRQIMNGAKKRRASRTKGGHLSE